MSNFKSMSDKINKVHKSYDIVKASQIEYERQRQNNHTKLIQNAVESAVGRGLGLVGNLSFSSVRSDNFGLDNISAQDLIPPRAIGPLEEIELNSVASDSIRLQNVLKNTQLKAEHRLRAKTELKKRARRVVAGTEDDKLFGVDIPNVSRDFLIIDTSTTSQSLYNSGNVAKHAMNKVAQRANVVGDSAIKLISNQYSVDDQYVAPYDSVSGDNFEFSIKNLGLDANSLRSFPATISTYNESVGASWDALGFVNAVEDSYVYQKTDKSFSLEFELFVSWDSENLPNGASPVNEFNDYIQFLNALTRPAIVDDRISAVPYCEITLGDWIVKQTAFIDSINLNYDPNIWNYTPGLQQPLFCKVSLTGKYFYGSPSNTTKFYGNRI